jgi:hypothetical protein
MGVTSTKSGWLEVNRSVSEKRDGKSKPFGFNFTFSCFRNHLEIMHDHPSVAAYVYDLFC